MSERDWDWTEDLYYEIVRPERPYPEAPLASRRADLSGLGHVRLHKNPSPPGPESSDADELSTRAENQAEALAVERHQEEKHDGAA